MTFAKGPALRYIGHLDLVRAWERALRRADLPVAFQHLGDNSITEAYAFLFGALLRSPAWLRSSSRSSCGRLASVLRVSEGRPVRFA